MATLVEKLMIVISKVTAPEEGGGVWGGRASDIK
jgi:hypothetical protein